MRMLFISNNWADAHQQARLNALLKMDLLIVGIAGFRDYYKYTSQISPFFIGNIKHGAYHKRIWVYIRLFCQLSKNTASGSFLYVFGFDLMLICLIFRTFSQRKIKVIYEIPDIRETFFSKSISGKLIRWVERKSIPKVELLIVTSPDFISKYFISLRKITISESLVIENKIHPADETLALSVPSIHQSKKIRVGYFGVLRCPASLECLIKLSQVANFQIVVHGIFMPLTAHYEKIIQKIDHIQYLGPFQSPEDLHEIYSSIDVVWAVYPFSKNVRGNHLLARTNRFYESLYFKKPAIVQKGSADAEKSALLGKVAFEIDLENETDVIRFLCQNLTPEKLAAVREKLLKIPKEHYQITHEYNDLAKWLQQNS